MPPQTRPLLLVDANVLIDYVKSEPSILALAAQHIGQVCVLSTVLDEVKEIDEHGCESLGLRVVEPALSDLIAAAQKRGALSAEDHLCLIMARHHGWTCVTNDKALRNACNKEQVAVLWGLELMLQLARAGCLSSTDALAAANAIHESNPLHITETIVRRFKSKLK